MTLNHKIRLIFNLAISIALVFTFSCSPNDGDSEQGEDSSFNENSQIYNKNGLPYKGSGDIKIDAMNVGSVKNGIVNLDLSKIIIPDEYLSDFYYEQLSCDDYPIGIKVSIVDNFKLFYSNSDDELLGRLRIEYFDEQVREGIFHLYSSKTGKINCNLASDSESFKINTDVEAGWNKIYIRQTRNSEEWSTDNILTKEVKWIIR